MSVKSAVLKLSTHITIDTRNPCKSVGYAGDITLAFITLVKTCFQLNRIFDTERLGRLQRAEPSTLVFPIKLWC